MYGISECWHLDVDGGNSTDSSIIAADNCNEFINKKISWMWVEFGQEMEYGFFEELRGNMELIMDWNGVNHNDL